LADLDLLEAVGPLSNIGLIATYIFSPIGSDPLLGTSFLFALSNQPLSIKTDSETRSIAIQVGF
jgi:hypothetical protein